MSIKNKAVIPKSRPVHQMFGMTSAPGGALASMFVQLEEPWTKVFDADDFMIIMVMMNDVLQKIHFCTCAPDIPSSTILLHSALREVVKKNPDILRSGRP